MWHALTAAYLTLSAAGTDPGASFSNPSSHGNRSYESRSFPIDASEPPSTPVQLGETAPDFSYQAHDGPWRHLHDLTRHASVLLVFGASERELRVLEQERERMLDMGVVAVAFLDVRSGAAWSTVNRLGLRYTVISDQRQVIATQFNLIEPTNGSTLPGWFMIDRQRKVRDLDRGRMPREGFDRLAARALGLPSEDQVFPTTR